MQCIWSTTAKAALRDNTRRGLSVLACNRVRTVWRSPQACGAFRRAHTASAPALDPNARPSCATAPNVIPTVKLFETDSDVSSMTAAQLSRAAAQAIRVAPDQDALYILQSLRYSVSTPAEKENIYKLEKLHRTTLRSPLDVHNPFEPIDFGQPVSPRLAAHCLLHLHLRRGRPDQAARIAEVLMKQSIPLRLYTLEAIVKALSTSDKSFWSNKPTFMFPRTLNDPKVLTLSSDSFSHPGCAVASRVLFLARKYGQARSDRMYEALVRACLIQGEIIVAALLFALLVKDWQIRSAHKLAEAEAAIQSDTMDGQESGNSTARGDTGRRRLDVDQLLLRTAKHRRAPLTSFVNAPYPSAGLLKAITNQIETVFLDETDSAGGDRHLHESLQALAILTMLVEEGDIHFGKLSPLIRALYKAPKTNHLIWKRDQGHAVQTKAYAYFHSALSRMIKALKDPPSMKIPPLDTRACNSLLHYALRHRLSPALASDVLEHMVVDRQLAPDPITFNVLIRSGTILRRKDISETALRILRRLNRQDTTTPVELQPKVDFQAADKQGISKRSQFGLALSRLRKEAIAFPKGMLDHKLRVQADQATVVSYIAHLTSSGDPEVIGNVLFHILPELTTIDHPSWGHLSPEERDISPNTTREESIKRGVVLGPYFFAVVLNALAKTGRTGLAERVWLFAKTAERASWIEDFLPGADPWCLPVSAYTSIMQCYANEGRKGLPIRKVIEDGRVVWVPRSNNHVRGWARLIYQTQRREGGVSKNWKRFRAARTMARLLLRAMLSGTSAVARSLLHLEETVRAANVKLNIPLPKPDARFFNTALKLFRPLPGMLPRRVRITRSRLRRFLRWAYSVYGQYGRRSEHWDVLLEDIASAMAGAGYPIPPAFRHLFIGRDGPSSANSRPPAVYDRSPYSYPPPRYRFRPYALPTSKTTGLPIRRTQPRQHRHARDAFAADTGVLSSS